MCETLSVNSGRYQIRGGIRCLALAAALGMSGGHWAVLQTIAWAKMIVQYSRQATLQTAIQQTFDGEHPCEMCRMIETARHASQPPAQEFRTTSTPDDNLLFATSITYKVDPPVATIIPAVDTPEPLRNDPPPVPPPRLSPS